MDGEKKDQRYPLYGIDENGKHQDMWAYTDIGPTPTKAFIVEHHDDEAYSSFFHLAVDKRPEYELYNTKSDPYCINNLSGDSEYKQVEKEMKKALFDELKKSKDPRIVGPDKEIFDSYPRYSPMREFPAPDQSL